MNYRNAYDKAYRASLRAREYLLRTIITPEQNTPLYDNVGKRIEHAVEDDRAYHTADIAQELPVSG